MLAKSFYPFYEGKISAVLNKIRASVCPMEILDPAVWSDLKVALYETMYRVSVRTLIAEMHECLDKGMIAQSTHEAEYQSFVELLKQEDYRKRLLDKYIGLSILLDNIEEYQYCFWSDFFLRLKKDWKMLIELFNKSERKIYIKSIRVNTSDSHLKGKTVIRILADNDLAFFYKPHGMGNETFLRDLIGQIGKAHGWETFRYKILDRNTYGWVEEIPCLPCESKEEVKSFYQKSGMLAAVSYILGIGDLHYENIIANRDNPVIIDAETLFQHMNPIYKWDEKENVFYSSLTSGLFPGGNVAKSLSGIMGGEEQLYDKEVPVIINDQTSEMRVEYKKPALKKGKNRVQYKSENLDISQYENDIIRGFDITYRWFLQNHMQVMEMITARKGQLYSRYISGGTQFFAMGISASTHPQLLMDRNSRRQYLDRITNGRPLNVWESEAMLDGDVPWFCRRLNDRDLYSGQKAVYPQFFGSTLLEELGQRFRQLTYEDNLLQQKVLRLSIRLFADEKKWVNNKKSRVKDIKALDTISIEWERERFLSAAKEIADEITSNAVRCGEKIFWFSFINVGKQLVIKPVDYYFYSGIGGITVFFRKMCAVYSEYEEISLSLEHMLFLYTDKVSSKEITPNTQYTGMYCGESSIAYAYQLLYQITNNSKYIRYAGRHLRAIGVYIEKDRKFDLLYGNAGIVLILCRQYIYTGDIYYRNEACRALAVLERNCKESEKGAVWRGSGNENSVCSIAHGNSGILLAYARLNSIMPDLNYIKRMKLIVSYENQFYDEQTGNWADLRKEGEDIYNTYAWCNGGLGVLYARMQAAKWNPKEKWLGEEVRKLIPLSRNLRVRDGMCFCHGNIGNFIILQEIAQYLDVMEINDVKRKFYNFILLELKENILPKIVTERYNVGLMNGLAGIGLAFINQLNMEK